MSVKPLSVRQTNLYEINDRVNQLMQGRSNAVGTVTLSTGTTTTVSAVTCGPNSAVILFPQTANAAASSTVASIPSTHITRGQFIVNHAANANTDKTYIYLTIG